MQKVRERFQIKADRWVYVPTPECVEVGNEIKSFIEDKWKAPPHFFHLRRGGHVDALRAHLDNLYFAKLDLSNFFGSINLTRVTRVLKEFLPYAQAREWAKSSVVKPNPAAAPHLPFGFVQSSILASVVFEASVLGKTLRRLAADKNPGTQVSVYVDDIILSSVNEDNLSDNLHRVIEAAHRSNFEVNEAKTTHPTQKIQAFNIDLEHGSMSVNKERMRQFMSCLESEENPNVIRGIHNYVRSVNPAQARLLQASTIN